MSRTNLIITNTFQCPDCNLMYYEGDTITIRTVNNQTIHDCDNCLAAIELIIKDNKVSRK